MGGEVNWLWSDGVPLSSSLLLMSGANLAEPLPPDPPVPGRTPREASEQVTRAMRSSVPLRAAWRARYRVGAGAEQFTNWTAIGELLSVPAGAEPLGYEFSGEIIAGGPWLAQGGGPRN